MTAPFGFQTHDHHLEWKWTTASTAAEVNNTVDAKMISVLPLQQPRLRAHGNAGCDMNTSWVFIFIHIVLVLKKDDSIHSYSFDFGNLFDFSKSSFNMFFFARSHERSPCVSHPRHSRWQGWIGREGWAARHLRNPHGDVIESCRTKNKKNNPTYRCMQDTKTHILHTLSCRLDTHQTYPNLSKKHACKLATRESFGHGRMFHN